MSKAKKHAAEAAPAPQGGCHQRSGSGNQQEMTEAEVMKVAQAKNGVAMMWNIRMMMMLTLVVVTPRGVGEGIAAAEGGVGPLDPGVGQSVVTAQMDRFTEGNLGSMAFEREGQEETGSLLMCCAGMALSQWQHTLVALLCVIPPDNMQQCRGAPILNGAFGVIKPNKYIEGPGSAPVLRLIMDFRVANSVGDVRSLAGPAAWQAIATTGCQVLASNADDFTACFYLFKVPYAWSRYFAFRRKVCRGSIGAVGQPDEMVYIARQSNPNGVGCTFDHSHSVAHTPY